MAEPFGERLKRLDGLLAARGSRLLGLNRALADEVFESQREAAEKRGDWKKILEGRGEEVPEDEAHSFMNFFYDRGDQMVRRVLLRTLGLKES